MIDKWKTFYLLVFILCILFMPLRQGAVASTTPPDKTDYPEPKYQTKGFNKDNSNLPGNRIYCLSKTIDGSIWIGTNKGAVRYDKGKWQGFSSEESNLLGNMVSFFFNSKDDSLWTATDKVVARFHKGKWQVFAQERDNFPDGRVNALIKGKDGKIWLGTQLGLAYFENSKWYKVMDRDGGYYKTSVNTLLETDSGALWVGTDSGLECLYKGEWQTWTGDRKFPNTPIITLLKNRHFLWIGTNSELGRINIYKGKWKSSTYEKKGSLNNHIITLCKTRDGSIWVGSQKKLYRFENERFKLFKNSKGDELKDRVNCLLDSHDGALWVGTDKGLFRIQKSWWQIFTPENSQLSGAVVRALLTMEDGTLWAGTDKGLAYFEEKKWQIFSDEESGKDIRGRGVLGLAEMGKGYLWVALENGLVTIQNGALRETWLDEDSSKADEPSEEYERFIKINAFMMPSDKTVWVGTDEALYYYRRKKWTFVGRNNSREPISGVNALLEAKDRSLYIGTEDGLVHRRMGEWIGVNDFKDTNITALVQMEDRTLWVGHMYDENDGSPGGLHYFKDAKWKPFEGISPEDIKKNHVTALLNAGEDTLWVGTKTGLARIHNKNKEMHLFTKDNCDLISDDITALSLGTDGVLWVGTPKGVVRFRPPTWEERPYVELIKTSNEKVLTQRAQTFNAFAFDPKYQTESNMFTYHWKILPEAGEVIPDQVSKESLLIYKYQDGCSYKVMVTCIDCYGYRSKPDEFQFRISLPDSPAETGSFWDIIRKVKSIIEKNGIELLILIFFLLFLFYPGLVARAVRNGYFDKFPQLIKIIVNSGRVRRRLFFPPKKKEPEGLQKCPQRICRADTSTAMSIAILNRNINKVLDELFSNTRFAMYIDSSNGGNSGLLFNLYNRTATSFRSRIKRKTYIPILIDIANSNIHDNSIDEIIRLILRGQRIKFPLDVIEHLLMKGGVIFFIDSLDRKNSETVKNRLDDFLNTNLDTGNRIFMASREDVLKRDVISLYTWCGDQERGVKTQKQGANEDNF